MQIDQQSNYGIISFILAVIEIIFFTVFFLTLGLQNEFIYFIFLFVPFLALTFGIAGLFQKKYRKEYAIFGTLISAIYAIPALRILIALAIKGLS